MNPGPNPFFKKHKLHIIPSATGQPQKYLIFVPFHEEETLPRLRARLLDMSKEAGCPLYVGNTLDLGAHFRLCKTTCDSTCNKPVVAIEPCGKMVRIFKTREPTKDTQPSETTKFPSRFRACVILAGYNPNNP